MNKLGIRFYQKIMKLGIKLMNFKSPKTYDNIEEILNIIKENKLNKIFIVTGKHTGETAEFIHLTNLLKSNNIDFAIFNEVQPDPIFDDIYLGKNEYLKNDCDSIIAFGGGSVLDEAKAIGALVTNLDKDLYDFRKLLNIKNKIPTLICVPTTCGTGSETTVAAVIRNDKTNEKFAISDPKLMPKYAILDARVLLTLPTNSFCYSVMDALTHSVESLISLSSTKKTRELSLKSIKLIKENAIKSYEDPTNLEYKNNLLYASYYAGEAFTRAFVGYVHSLAHILGALYHLPHGELCGIILPYILEEYFDKIYKKLCRTSIFIGLGSENNSEKDNAKLFIEFIKDLNKKFNLPTNIKEIKTEDLDLIVETAQKETIPNYPVPKLLTNEELKNIVIKIKGV